MYFLSPFRIGKSFTEYRYVHILFFLCLYRVSKFNYTKDPAQPDEDSTSYRNRKCNLSISMMQQVNFIYQRVDYVGIDMG